MLKAALKNHRNFLFIHLAEGSPVQKAEIGTQLKIVVKTPCVPYIEITAIATQQANRMRFPTKTRKYWKRIDSFVKVRDIA